MKKFTIFLMFVFCGISLTSVHAQKTKTVQKIYKEVKSVLKNAKPPRRAVKVPKERIVTEEQKCSQCNGNGIVTQYNPYSGLYYDAYCPTCNGCGKVLKRVKKIFWE